MQSELYGGRRNTREYSNDLLGRHFAGTQGCLSRPQPVKVEADDVAVRECSRKQADPFRPKPNPDDHNRARCMEEREAATKKVDLLCMPDCKGLRRHREETAPAFEWINYAPRYVGPRHGRSWLVTRLKPVD